MITPLTMQIALACYTSPDPAHRFSPSTWGSAPAIEARRWLFGQGLIDALEGSPAITKKGKAWVERALSTPLPIQTWVFPDDAASCASREPATDPLEALVFAGDPQSLPRMERDSDIP